jgi:hypothetical protein
MGGVVRSEAFWDRGPQTVGGRALPRCRRAQHATPAGLAQHRAHQRGFWVGEDDAWNSEP